MEMESVRAPRGRVRAHCPSLKAPAEPRGVEVRENLLGKGVYATRAFAAGATVVRGWGQLVTTRVRESVQVGPDLHVVPDAPIVYLNHSCEPSCGLLIDRDARVMEVRALRRLRAGEEVTVDYATFEYEIAGYDGPCLCGAGGCRGRVTGYKDLPAELRAAYGPYVAEHLREADDPARAAPRRR